jgi:Fe2+ or Zn2+ uptake regulation protein
MRASDDLCQRFRSLGYKVTPQRRYIFRVLEGNVDHLSADDVYARVREYVPDISLATVYNTLRELVELGEIRQLDLGEGKCRYDPQTNAHQHLTCVSCREVIDVHCDMGIAGLSEEQRQGYGILGADVTWYGVCPSCQAQHDHDWPRATSRLWGVSDVN